MFGTERPALALIALITGVMGFIESMLAVPAGSTALAADALAFVQHSMSAGFALWSSSVALERQRWTVQLQGLTMAILGALVCVIAIRRFVMGSIPHPIMMTVIGLMALGAHLTVGAIMMGQRRQPMNLAALWSLTRMDAVGNVAVIAAAGLVVLTRSNIPDLVIGGAMAALFFLSGWRIALSGRLDAGADTMKQLKPLETALERALFASRWLMAPFYLGLVFALAVLMVMFVREIVDLVPKIMGLDEAAVILWVLTLIDLSLAGNLILMVVFSGYENFVSKMDIQDHPDRPAWMGTIDFSAMKLKLLASIVAISAIHLLKTFMSIDQYQREQVYTLMLVHLTFVVSGAVLALTDYISEKAEAKHHKHANAPAPADNHQEHRQH